MLDVATKEAGVFHIKKNPNGFSVVGNEEAVLYVESVDPDVVLPSHNALPLKFKDTEGRQLSAWFDLKNKIYCVTHLLTEVDEFQVSKESGIWCAVTSKAPKI